MEKKSCFWGHNWAGWKEIERGEIKNAYGTNGNYIIQENTCANCGYKKLDTERTRI